MCVCFFYVTLLSVLLCGTSEINMPSYLPLQFYFKEFSQEERAVPLTFTDLSILTRLTWVGFSLSMCKLVSNRIKCGPQGNSKRSALCGRKTGKGGILVYGRRNGRHNDNRGRFARWRGGGMQRGGMMAN